MLPTRGLLKYFGLIHLIFLFYSNVYGDESNPSKSNEKRAIRCAVSHNPPYEIIRRNPNGTLSFSGGTIMVQYWYSRRLNFTLEFVLPDTEHIQQRGQEAVIDLVARKDADYVGAGLVPTPARLEVVDPGTYIAWEEGYRLVVPIPGEEDRLFAFILPFDSTVWLLLFLSLLVVVVAMSAISWMYYRFFRRDLPDQSFGQFVELYLFYNINVLTNHGDYLKLNHVTSFLLCVALWLMGASILMYGYSSIVVSSLTVPKMKPMINSFQDLVHNTEVSVLIRSDVVMGQLMLTSDAPIYSAIREKVARDPKSLITKNVTLINQLLLKGKHAYAFVETFDRFFIASEYKKNGKCKNKLSKRIPTSINFFYLFFPKDSHLRREFSIAAMELWETGQTRFWVNNELPKADVCFAPVQGNRPKQAAIKLEDLTSAFFILGVGVAFSLSTFVIELLTKRLSRDK